MHFRVRGNKIQVLRSVYDPGLQRSQSRTLCVISKSTLKVSDDAMVDLSETERAEIESFLASYRNTQLLKQKLTAHQLPDTVADVVEYFNLLEDGAEKDVIRNFIAQAVLDLRRLDDGKRGRQQSDAKLGSGKVSVAASKRISEEPT